MFATGDRVVLERHGRVDSVRSGFASVRWDDGSASCEWASELVAEPMPDTNDAGEVSS
jgi:hypothetical protein